MLGRLRSPIPGLVLILALICAVADGVLARGGGGGGGRGGGGGGRGGMGGGRGWGFGNGMNGSTTPWWQRQQATDPVVAQKKADEKARKLVADGWEDLRAGDATAAFEAFADALQLNANLGEARFGQGMARAAKGDFSRAVIDFDGSRLLSVKPDFHLVTYNTAVAQTRLNAKPRALVLFNTAVSMSLAKTPDELMLNAQLAVLSTMDDKARKAVGQMPEFLKTVSNANGTLASKKYTGLERFGLAWVSADQARALKTAGTKEVFPDKLPFLLPPGTESMPEPTGTIAYALLMPAGDKPVAAPAVAVAAAAADPKAAAPVKPKVAPVVVGADTAPKVPAGGFKLGGGNDVPAAPPAAGPAVATAQPEVPAPSTSTTPEVVRRTRTVHGAAFAVTNDTLVTCARLVAGAKEIQLQSTEGKAMTAHVVATDDASGLALIKVAGGSFKPMGLADAAHAGKVGVAAFFKPTVFNPDVDLASGDLYGAPGSLALRCVQHPRSAGCPVVNDKGLVLAVVTASREDTFDKLPVVPVEVLRRFVEGKLSLSATASDDPDASVAELTATRQD